MSKKRKNHLFLPAEVSVPGLKVEKRKLCFESCEDDVENFEEERTLRILNFPITFDFSDLKQVLSCFGAVEKSFIPFGQKSYSRFGFVQYYEKSSVETAFKFEPEKATQPAHKGSLVFGVSKWLTDYHRLRPSPKILENMVDRFMEEFDKREQTIDEEEKQKAEEEADDGWTYIGRKKGKKRRLQKSKEVAAKRQKINPNFYKKNMKSANQKRVELLRQKFSEDRQKLKRLREQRRFKPGW